MTTCMGIPGPPPPAPAAWPPSRSLTTAMKPTGRGRRSSWLADTQTAAGAAILR
jgi:hypothetical protein